MDHTHVSISNDFQEADEIILKGILENPYKIFISTYKQSVMLDEAYKEYKMNFSTKNNPNCLISGPPGTGKTVLAKYLTKNAFSKDIEKFVKEMINNN